MCIPRLPRLPTPTPSARWLQGFVVFIGLILGQSAARTEVVSLAEDFPGPFGILTNQKWWAGYANAGLLQVALSPDYTWASPQFGYGDAGFDWQAGPILFKSNGTEQFTHHWDGGATVLQNAGVVKILYAQPDVIVRSATVELWGGVPTLETFRDGWFAIQRHGYNEPDLINQTYNPSLIEGRAHALRISDLQIDSGYFMLTIAGAAGMPYLGLNLELNVEPAGGPAVPEPAEAAPAIGLGLVVWAIIRARRPAGRTAERRSIAEF